MKYFIKNTVNNDTIKKKTIHIFYVKYNISLLEVNYICT